MPRSRSTSPIPPGDQLDAGPRAAVLGWLESRVNYERLTPTGPGGDGSFGLARMRRLLALIGSPHDAFPVVHVAGTKGKGSTVAMIAAILGEAGLRVGRYLSPHVHRLEERIAVDGRPIPEADLLRSFATVVPAVERLDASALRRGTRVPTWFEVVTAVAFDHFARTKVDIAVLETGLGGRLDATNVSRPVVSVITSISLDHMAILGPTVRHIATEKAGIIKRGCAVVCGAHAPAARRVIIATARKRRAPLRLIDRDFTISHAPANAATPLAGGTLLLHATGSGPELAYPLSMAGRHQADNAGLAVMTIGELRRHGFSIPETAVRAGLASVHLPARIERIADRPLVILDAAHNVASMESLVETLEAPLAATAARGAPRVLLFAASADKQIEEMLACCRGRFDRVVVTRYLTNPRAATTERLVAACAAAGLPVPMRADSPAAALATARKLAGARGLVCIAGSFFLATEIGAG
jgi:dihydrofolate synthase / folylpolyglutamate synthase